MAYFSFFVFIQIGLLTLLIKQEIALSLHCFFPTLSTALRKGWGMPARRIFKITLETCYSTHKQKTAKEKRNMHMPMNTQMSSRDTSAKAIRREL